MNDTILKSKNILKAKLLVSMHIFKAILQVRLYYKKMHIANNLTKSKNLLYIKT